MTTSVLVSYAAINKMHREREKERERERERERDWTIKTSEIYFLTVSEAESPRSSPSKVQGLSSLWLSLELWSPCE
jgi:hypothetical protein